MKPYLHPVPIACLLITVIGAVVGNLGMTIVGLIGAIAGVGFIAARHAQDSRGADQSDTLSNEGRTLLRPVKGLADEIATLIDTNKDSQTIRIMGGEALEESKGLLGQVVRSLQTRDELKRTLRGRYEAEKEIGDARMRLEFANGPEKESLDTAIAARTQELAHYGEIERHIKRIELSVNQAEAALAEMKARLAATASGEKEALGSGDDLRETIGRLKSLSASYDEAEQVIRGTGR